MVSRFLTGLGKTLISLGLLTFLFVGFQLWGTGVEESKHQQELTDDLRKQVQDLPAQATDVGTLGTGRRGSTLDEVVDRLSAVHGRDKALAAPKTGDTIGVIEIPKLAVKKVFVEGTDTEDLRKGPGHYSDTPFPGTKGNAGIAGHRTTYGAPFSRLDELQPNDIIKIYTRQGRFDFSVLPTPADAPGEKGAAWWVVTPEDVHVLADKGDTRITLTACHPKLSDKRRIIVSARLTGTAPPAVAPAKPTATNQTTTAATAKKKLATAFDESLTWKTDLLPKVAWWAAAAFGVWLLAYILGRVLNRKWTMYLVASPVFFFCIWYTFTWVNRAMPPL